jgi:hypothetical protein
VVEEEFSQTIVFLYYAPQIQDLELSVDFLLADMETPKKTRLRKSSRGYHHAYSAYLDACVGGLWDEDSCAGVIPCRSLWNKDSRRLAAVLIFQSSAEPRNILV